MCPEWQTPSGGIRKLYRHVDVLAAHGYPAVIAHHQPGFRVAWFANDTPIAYPPECYPSSDDLLVCTEIHSWDICAQTPGVAKVVFNQNAYQTFMWQTDQFAGDPAPYQRPEVRATIVVSEDNRDYLRHAFPNHGVYRIRYSIDPQLFHFESRKLRRMAYMPRKVPADAVQVLGILESRGVLSGWEVVKIEGKSEAETAAILRESAVFLSFATEEGWSLPPMEAMACGCVVIGYHGRGGREYFTAERGFPIAKDDVVGFAAAVERVLADLARDPAPLAGMARRASEFVVARYTPAVEEADILEAWRQIVSRFRVRPGWAPS